MTFLSETQCFISMIPNSGMNLITAIFILFYFLVVLLVFTKIIGFVIQPPLRKTSGNKTERIISSQQYDYRNRALYFASISLGIIMGVLGSIWITYAPEVLQFDKTFLFWSSFWGFWILLLAMVMIYLFYFCKAINCE